VASEFHEISTGMKVIKFNEISCQDMGYFKSMHYIDEIWQNSSSVKLEIEYDSNSDSDSDSDSDLPVTPPEPTTRRAPIHRRNQDIIDINDVNIFIQEDVVYKFLKEVSCELYYDKFVELGAKEEIDFLFVEEQDLIKMEMPVLKHRRLWGKISALIVKNSESM